MILKWVLVITFLLSTILISSSQVNASLIDDLLIPFQVSDFSTLYDSYGPLIDLIIFSIFFVGLSQAALGKRFDSRGGKAVVAAVGLVLAIALLISESQLGFNLRSFGPLAAGIFIFIVGSTIFYGFKKTGMKSLNSGSIALIVTYFSIRAVTPNFFTWMMGNPYTAWIHSVIIIGVIVSITKLAITFFSNTGWVEEKRSKKNPKAKAIFDLNYFKKKNSDKKLMQKQINSQLNGLTKDVTQKTDKTVINFNELKKIIEEYASSGTGRKQIIRKLEDICLDEKQITSDIIKLTNLCHKLAKFDHRNFKFLIKQFRELPKPQQKSIENELKNQWSKIDAENKIMKLDKSIHAANSTVNHTLKMIISALKENKIKDCLEWVDIGIKFEQKLLMLLEQLKDLEFRLERYTTTDVKLNT